MPAEQTEVLSAGKAPFRPAASDSQTYIVPSDGALDDVPPVVCDDSAAVSSPAEETPSPSLLSAGLRCSLGCD